MRIPLIGSGRARACAGLEASGYAAAAATPPPFERRTRSRLSISAGRARPEPRWQIARVRVTRCTARHFGQSFGCFVSRLVDALEFHAHLVTGELVAIVDVKEVAHRCPPFSPPPPRPVPKRRSPTPAPAATAPQQPCQQQQEHGPERRADNRGEDAGAEPDAETREQQARNQRADDADDEVADEAEAGPLHELSGEPPGDQADQQDDGKTFA